MSQFFDARETRRAADREAELFARLPQALDAAMRAPAYARHLGEIEIDRITDRAALAQLPILRKSDLPALQKQALPFGGLVPASPGAFGRLFTSPGPIYEPEGREDDPWRAARGLHAMGLRPGDIVLNTFSYHMTPGGFLMDSGARALGCAVIPAGPGNTEAQLDLIEAFRPNVYAGTPDFLKILLDAAAEKGRDVSSIKKAGVSGAAFPKSLQAAFAERGIVAHQAYATADIGFIAYETGTHDGLVVNEDIILELVRPGTGDPVTPGEVGLSVVNDPLSRLFESTGPFQYEAVAFIELGVVDYLFAPLTAAVGLGLAVLVGLNLAVAYGAWRRPAACRLPARGGADSTAGVLAGVPALLSGTVCCGPAILLVVGVQATAGILAVFQWLLPVAVVLLVGSLVLMSRRVQL